MENNWLDHLDSVGANYIEANESVSDKDLFIELKSAERRQKKVDTGLRLLDINGESELDNARKVLIQESTELMNLFSSILQKKE